MEVKQDTCIVIQARTDSRRLPGKILRLISIYPERTALEHLLSRLRMIDDHYKIILATTDRFEDNRLRQVAAQLGVEVYAGDLNNVGERLYKATKGYKYFVRITGDDIFTDIRMLNRELIRRDYVECDYQYCTNIIPGMDFEIIKRDSLKKIIDKYGDDHTEHIEHFFKNDNFKVRELKCYDDIDTNLSLTMDTEDDFKLITSIANQIMYLRSADQVNSKLKQYPLLADINKRPMVSCYSVIKDVNEDEFEQCIMSVVNQDFKDFEYYIIDYGSACLNYLKKIPNNFKYKFYHLSGSNSFIDAIKYAHKIAAGKYVIRADADDYMYSDCISQQIKVIGDNSIVIPDHQTSHSTIKNLTIAVDGKLNKLVCHSLVEKKKLDAVRYVQGQTFRDGTALLACFMKFGFKVKYLNQVLFYHRKKKSSLTANKNLEKIDMDICSSLGANYDAIK